MNTEMGEEAIKYLASQTRDYPGRCEIGTPTIAGNNGMGYTMEVDKWRMRHRLTQDHANKMEQAYRTLGK